MISEEVGGIIYPLKEHNFNILQKRTKPIYVKYLSRGNGKYPTKLKQGHFLLFYLSGGKKSIVGYSKISNVLIQTPIEVKQNYGSRMQMSNEEFNDYTIKRKNKTMIVLSLDNIITLKKNFPVDFPITMAGKYLSKDQLKHFIK